MDATPDPLADDLAAVSAAVDGWLAHLTLLRDALRAMQASMPRAEFEAWARVTAGLDAETLTDFLTFDGNLTRGTDRMLVAMQRVVTALN